MSLSSLFVVCNALRLTRFGKSKMKASASVKEEIKEIEERKEKNKMTKTLKIEGMMCNHCVMHVTKALEGVAGVEKVEVDLKGKTAKVTLSAEVADSALSGAVKEAGYEVIEIG